MFTIKRLLEVGVGATHGEGDKALAVLDALGQRELDLGVVELLDLGPATAGCLQNLHFDDLDGMSARAMASSHVAVALCHGTAHRQVAVLSVHVVCSRAGVVAQPHTEVLDLQWRLLRDFLQNRDTSENAYPSLCPQT